jgi:hypothetical protein
MNIRHISNIVDRKLVTLFTCVLLAACGGGGGSDAPNSISGSTSTSVAPPVTITAIANTSAQSLTVGKAMANFSPLTASGGTPPYTYSVTSGTLPAGLSLNTSTGVVTGTPDVTYSGGNVVFSVKDQNNVVASTTSSVSFTVGVAAIAPPATISAIANPSAQSLTVGKAMANFSPLTASGGTPPYTYSVTSGTLPAGLSLNTSTGSVAGIPTATYPTANVVFSVKDKNNVVASTTSTVSFTVGAAVVTPPATITATANLSVQNLKVGTAMASFSPLTPSGGTTPYTYGVTSGTLPAGLSLDTSTGLVAGTPTATYPTANVVFSVKDKNNVVASTTNTVSFTVGAAVAAPPVTINATANTSAQNLTVGKVMPSFSPLTPSGGATPYTYSITSGSLPAGVTLNSSTGAVTGTPTVLYTAANVVFSVKDSNNVVASTTSSVSFTVGMDFSVSTTSANASLGAPFMGHSKLMVGFSGSSTAGDQAPFDMQYQYINSGKFSSYNHAGCIAGTVSTSLCSGWTAWQEDIPARGLFATRFVGTAKGRTWNSVSRPQIPYFTYYMMLPASGLSEGPSLTGETAALDDQTFLTTYFNDWRFLLQKIGTEKAVLHIEPDLFGYLKARAATTTGLPSAIPAKVALSNPTDCGSGYTNDAAGYVKCMIHMVRVYAPNAKVGLHASPWVISDAEATAWSNFLIALGAGDGDFLVTDPSDRDADWYRLVKNETWHDWDVAKMNTFLQWIKVVSTTVGKPFFLWQLPLGNSYQNNTKNHYKDQRVELLFSHIAEVRDANVVGMLFGSGEGDQTYVDSDGGLLVGKTRQHYINRGGE